MLTSCRAFDPRSQVHPARTVIGYLTPIAPNQAVPLGPSVPPPDPADPFWRALHVRGWDIGQNLAVEYRQGTASDGTPRDFGGPARELVELDVALILTAGETAARAAKRATTTIPIFFIASFDPVGSGLVETLARPGGNVTGVSTLIPELSAKKLQLLREVAPAVARVAVLWSSVMSDTAWQFQQVERAAQALGVEVHSIEAGSATEIALALTSISPGGN